MFSLQPWTSKDFTIRSLADRIADLNHLVNLYPDINKDLPFGKYYTPYQGMFYTEQKIVIDLLIPDENSDHLTYV